MKLKLFLKNTHLDILKQLDNQSYNNLITEGLRHVVEYKKQHLSQRRKTRETLSNMIKN